MTMQIVYYQQSSQSTTIGGYRYFFNGQEGDNEVFTENGLFAFEYRMHDARLGRFWSVDPLTAKYPWNSTYAFCENSPIFAKELEGLEAYAVFNRKTNKLAVIPDISELKPALTMVYVSASEYAKLTNSQKEKNNYGIIVENVFSGGHLDEDRIIQNDESRHKEIPIPIGTYNILENKGNENPAHDKFFVLDPQDDKPYNKIDDRKGMVNSDGEQRSGYNLHPGETSWGCITIAYRTPEKTEQERSEEWNILYDAITNTTSTTVPDNRGKHRFLPWEKQIKYGTLKVIDK